MSTANTFQIKTRSGKVIEDNIILSIVTELVELQKSRRKYRELFHHHTAMILEMDIIESNSARPVWPGCTYSTHAEVSAIKRLPHNFSKRTRFVTILVIRTDAAGKLQNSKPCALCLKHFAAIKKNRWGISTIYYSDENGNIIKDNFRNMNVCNDKYVCRRQRKCSAKY